MKFPCMICYTYVVCEFVVRRETLTSAPPHVLIRGEQGSQGIPTAEEGSTFFAGGWHVKELGLENQHKDPRERGCSVPFTSTLLLPHHAGVCMTCE